MSIRADDHTDEILEKLKQAIEAGLEAIGTQAEGYAALALESSPRRVDTGLLRNSITHAVSGHGAAKGTYTSDDGSASGSYSGTAPDGSNKLVMVGTNVAYAGYVQFGTSKMAPNAFLASAASHNDEYSQILKQYLEEAE